MQKKHAVCAGTVFGGGDGGGGDDGEAAITTVAATGVGMGGMTVARIAVVRRTRL